MTTNISQANKTLNVSAQVDVRRILCRALGSARSRDGLPRKRMLLCIIGEAIMNKIDQKSIAVAALYHKLDRSILIAGAIIRRCPWVDFGWQYSFTRPSLARTLKYHMREVF